MVTWPLSSACTPHRFLMVMVCVPDSRPVISRERIFWTPIGCPVATSAQVSPSQTTAPSTQTSAIPSFLSLANTMLKVSVASVVSMTMVSPLFKTASLPSASVHVVPLIVVMNLPLLAVVTAGLPKVHMPLRSAKKSTSSSTVTAADAVPTSTNVASNIKVNILLLRYFIFCPPKNWSILL